MGKHLLIATCWGLATWTWLSMAAFFLPIPDLGLIGGGLTALAMLARAIPLSTRPAVETPSQLADNS
jgi:hypothetical protein